MMSSLLRGAFQSGPPLVTVSSPPRNFRFSSWSLLCRGGSVDIRGLFYYITTSESCKPSQGAPANLMFSVLMSSSIALRVTPNNIPFVGRARKLFLVVFRFYLAGLFLCWLSSLDRHGSNIMIQGHLQRDAQSPHSSNPKLQNPTP